jgi:hypothetical protein
VRNLWGRSGRNAVLAMAPLAMAVIAHASPSYTVLPAGNFTCAATGTSSNDCSDVAGDGQLGNAGGIAGISFFTLPEEQVSIPVTTDGVATLEMSAGGTLNQPLDEDVPVSWNFTLSAPGDPDSVNWSLLFVLSPTSNPLVEAYGSSYDTGSGVGSFSGSDLLTLGGPVTGTVYETVELTVNSEGNGDVDITAPFSMGSVPEPASVATLGAGLGLLGWLYRRKRA